MTDLPFVSVIIPFRNEEKFIGKCLDSVLASDYPVEKTEILLVDGMSTDHSRAIIGQFTKRFNHIFILDNPKRIFPAAVNTGVKKSRGKLILILGAHAIYHPSYIRKCVAGSLEHDAENVGGVLVTTGLHGGIIGRSVNLVLSSSFGVGNATFRTGAKTVTETDTVFGGCYKKEVFEKIGFLDERLVSSSDIEFNKRLKRSGGKILLLPEIVVNYYTRNTFSSFIRNNFRNGFWAIYPIAFTKHIPVSLRHFVPLLFLLSILGCFLGGIFLPFFLWFLLAELLIYFLGAIVASISSAHHDLPCLLTMPLLFLFLHLVYGTGSLVAVLKIPFVKKPSVDL